MRSMWDDLWVWLPFAVAGVLLAGFALILHRRKVPAGSTAELLLIRGLVLVVLGGLIATLADAAAEGDGVTFFDRPVWSWFVGHRSGFGTAVFTTITTIGGTVAMTAYATVGFIVLCWRRRMPDAFLVAAVAAGAGLLVRLGKTVVGRVRPPLADRLVVETNQSFPSGHSLASSAIVGVLLLTLLPLLPAARHHLRVGLLAAGTVLVALIGVSRLYLGVHWATDVLGGWLVGISWLLLCVTVRRLVFRIPPTVLRLGSGSGPPSRTKIRPD